MKKRHLIIILVVALAFSCNSFNCQYTVTSQYIKSNCGLFNGYEVQKINVLNIENNIPVDYTIELSATFGSKSLDSFDKMREKKLNKVYFKKEIEGYQWYSNIIPEGTSRIIPFDFESNQWYLIRGLGDKGKVGTVFVFIHVMRDGEFKVYRWNKPTNY